MNDRHTTDRREAARAARWAAQVASHAARRALMARHAADAPQAEREHRAREAERICRLAAQAAGRAAHIAAAAGADESAREAYGARDDASIVGGVPQASDYRPSDRPPGEPRFLPCSECPARKHGPEPWACPGISVCVGTPVGPGPHP